MVLNNINIDIRHGEFFTLLGPSGCGKTTLLRIIAGFLQQNIGTVYFDDECIDPVPAHKRNIGMVFQDYAVFPHLTVRDNVAFGLKARNLPRDELNRRVDEALATVRLESFETRMPSSLSGGQQQRVGIARALAIRPRLLLMDEPLSNLDAKLRVEMRDDIRDIQKSLGITTIYVTHDQEEALAISDRICVLEGGFSQQVGTPTEIYWNPTRLFTAGFIGTMNFFSAEISGGGLRLGTQTLRLTGAVPDGAVTAAIRPEDISLEELPSSVAAAVPGRIEKTTFLGREATCSIAGDLGPCIVSLRNATLELLTKTDVAAKMYLPFNKIKLFDAAGTRLETGLSS
ncbi:MAG: ABC transporter ATP-binding protein [Methylobacteriaceae bacterium]|jgi:ABC-type Fe3+/spermidine/putrescine transport system ATPase subunit|nr:ABC transporter ATP-binding protein [Methylobacteriaceae bacterium]